MPMPSLYPLVKAAYQAYDDLSKARNASYFYLYSVFIWGATKVGYDDTNPDKIKILKNLAELKPSDTVEEQNKILLDSFHKELLEKKNWNRYVGPIFTPLSSIMLACMHITQLSNENSSVDSIEKHFSKFGCGLSYCCEELKKKGLAQDHLFFKELHNFITELKANANEVAVQNLLAMQPVLERANTVLELIQLDASTAHEQVQGEKRQQDTDTEIRLERKEQMGITPQIKAWMHNKHASQNPKLAESVETRSLSDISRNLGFHNKKFSKGKGKNHYGYPFQPDHAKHSNKIAIRRI